MHLQADHAAVNLKVVTNKEVGMASNIDLIDAQVAHTQPKADWINAFL